MKTLNVTHRDVRKAFYALTALAAGQVMEGNKPYAPALKIKTNLKIKRMIGSLKPFIEGMQDEEQKILKDYPDWKNDGSTPAPAGLNEKLGEIYDTPCTVYGIDQLDESDFNYLDTAPTVLVGVLVDVGPFFDDGVVQEAINSNHKAPADEPVAAG